MRNSNYDRVLAVSGFFFAAQAGLTADVLPRPTIVLTLSFSPWHGLVVGMRMAMVPLLLLSQSLP